MEIEPTYSIKVNEKLHDDLSNVPQAAKKEMNEKIREILMQYAFLHSNNYRAPYKGDQE